MNYTVFSDHTIGESHIRAKMTCEDFSDHYSDPEGRYMIAAVCDGHSDPKCFRSSRGARMGCETVVQILRNLFEIYCAEDPEDALEQLSDGKQDTLARVRAAILQEWNRKVQEDLRRNPVTREEYAALDTPQYRGAMKYYQAGRGQNNIYGATMLAVAACRDFHLVMQIGDGITVRLNGNGRYDVPLEEDKKDEMTGPASLCDTDLLERETAFRVGLFGGIPQALFVTSDGVGDGVLSLSLREHLCTLQRELIRLGEEEKEGEGKEEGALRELNARQEELLRSFLSFYSHRGLEDDCCLAGFFDTDMPVADVALSQDEIDGFYQELEKERREKQNRYLTSKERLQNSCDEIEGKIQNCDSQIAALKRKIEELERDLDIKRDEPKQMREAQSAGEADRAAIKQEWVSESGQSAADQESVGKSPADWDPEGSGDGSTAVQNLDREGETVQRPSGEVPADWNLEGAGDGSTTVQNPDEEETVQSPAGEAPADWDPAVPEAAVSSERLPEEQGEGI